MLSDDSDNEDVTQLTINEHYAKAFEYRKEREELERREFLFSWFQALNLRAAQ